MEKRVLRCEECDTVFASRGSFHYHNKHKPKTCERKKRSFRAKKTPKQKCLKCPNCPRVFPNQFNLSRHLTLCQKRPKPTKVHVCKYCRKTFTRKDNMNRHIKKKCSVAKNSQKMFFLEDNKIFPPENSLPNVENPLPNVEKKQFQCPNCLKFYDKVERKPTTLVVG